MLILASETDAAAINVRDRLLEFWDHDIAGDFRGRPIYRSRTGKTIMTSMADHALEFDDPHIPIITSLPSLSSDPSTDIDVIMYLSRHQSESGNRTLTVHPIGNFNAAAFGGRERTVVPTAPHLMTHALRLLSDRVPETYECTFEATHHGPYNTVPTFFIEIGSTIGEWTDPAAVQALADTVHEFIEDYENDRIPKRTVCIGLGGGHYCPRHTKFALKEELDFGHILPAYARKGLDVELAQQIISRTPGVERICAHGKKLRKEGRIFSELGIEYVEY